MNEFKILIDSSVQEKMSNFNRNWSEVCCQAIENEINRLTNQLTNNSFDSIVDIDLPINRSEIENFEIPDFPRNIYQTFRRVWVDCYKYYSPQPKPPTSLQIKQLWNSWYSPFFDDGEWFEKWEDKKYERQNYPLSEQEELVLSFDAEVDDYSIYTAFIQFVSRFIFEGEVLDILSLNPLNLKSVKIEERDNLPEESGIYFVIDESKIYYIGMSVNLQRRWYSHHRQQDFNRIPNLQISYLDYLPKHYLKRIESTLINHFKPYLNIRENPLYRKI